MFIWVMENTATIIISIVLLIVVAAVVASMIRNKKKGNSSCGCGCAGCAMNGACHSGAGTEKRSGKGGIRCRVRKL